MRGLSYWRGICPWDSSAACGMTGTGFFIMHDDNFSIMTDFNNLYKAHRSCRKGKRWKDSVAIYDIRGFECTLKVQELLKSGKYRLSPYNCFVINERGKHRDIKSIKYHDRVVQKVLMDNILTPAVTPSFIDTNCASLKYKGTDYALYKLRQHLETQVRKNKDSYILKCDMKGYFDSIPHELLDSYYEKNFSDEWLIGLIKHIHASIPGGVGVPLGNQLSQLDALLALSPLDHIIKEKLHIEGYGRYMDDFYLISEDKEYLRECLGHIRNWVDERGMRLNTKKTKITTIRQGIDFLGFRFYVTESGKVIQKLSHQSIVHHKAKLRKMAKLFKEGKCTFEACKDAHNGWKAHAQRGKKKRGEPRGKRSRANTYYLVRKMDALFDELFKDYIEKEAENVKTTKRTAGGGAR